MKNLLLLFDGIHFEGGLGMAAVYAVLGFLFVFLGIALLIVILSLIGLGMKKYEEKRAEKNKTENAGNIRTAPVAEAGISPEVVAAITAAIAAYTAQENSKCEFVVRRIKRI